MNPAQLLTHFHRLAEAPEAIPRLRRFILDLAVRGKLVAQDPEDEPAERLLLLSDSVRKNVAKNDRRADEGRQTILAEEQRWTVPPTWKWRGLADLVLFIDYRGQTPNKTDSGVRLITAKNVKKGFVSLSPEEFLSDQDYPRWMTRGIPQVGDVLFTTEAPMGNAAVVRTSGRFALAQRIINFRLYGSLDPDFLVTQLLSDPFQKVLDKMATGLTAKGIKASKLKCLPISIPPLAEQQRIVARVGELMALCDRLDAVQAEREQRRVRLVASTHAGLATSESQHASFFIRHFPTLTTHPDQIPQLRQTIFNLAVRGKLVAQDPKEESAPSFGIEESVGASDRLDFEIPQGWRWAKVEDVADSRLGKMLDKAKNKGRSYRYLGNSNVQWFEVRLDALKEIQIEDGEIGRYLLRDGDVLICEGGQAGRSAVWRFPDTDIAFQKALHRVRPGSLLNSDFFAQCMFTYYHSGVLNSYYTGIGIPHFTGRSLAKLVFPLPPIAEQQRIVEKVAELMALCDRLEAQLRTTQKDSRRLLASVLNSALAPAA